MCTVWFVIWNVRCWLRDFIASISESVDHSKSQHLVMFDLGALLSLQGLSMFTVSDDLVLYGGDKSGLTVCSMTSADWKWAAPAITGEHHSPHCV